MELKTLEKLIMLAKKQKLAELEVESGKTKYRIKTSIGARMAASQPGINPSLLANPTPPVEAKGSAQSGSKSSTKTDEKYVKVLSPFVGTFYRSPSPDSSPYVSDGVKVNKGDVLCIIEAMKLMNEIEAEITGKVVSVLAENGQAVEYGEPLFLIDPI